MNDEVKQILYFPSRKICIVALLKEIQIYNKEYKFLRKIDKIGNNDFYPQFIETNNKNGIFICNPREYKIMFLNLDTEETKETISRIDVILPRGMFYINNKLYVCDGNMNKIKTFDENLIKIEEYCLDIFPCDIKIINDVACVYSKKTLSMGTNVDIIKFYNINGFLQIGEYKTGPRAFISAIGLNFYAYDSTKIITFDEEGKSLQEIHLRKLPDICVERLESMDFIDGFIWIKTYKNVFKIC